MLVADVDWDKELIQSEDVTIWYLSTPSVDVAVVESSLVEIVVGCIDELSHEEGGETVARSGVGDIGLKPIPGEQEGDVSMDDFIIEPGAWA